MSVCVCVRGGTAITIEGSGLDTSQEPNMTIVVEIKTRSAIQANTYDYKYTFFPTVRLLCLIDNYVAHFVSAAA